VIAPFVFDIAARCLALRFAKRPEGFGAALRAGSFAEGETAIVLPEAKLQKHRALRRHGGRPHPAIPIPGTRRGEHCSPAPRPDRGTVKTVPYSPWARFYLASGFWPLASSTYFREKIFPQITA